MDIDENALSSARAELGTTTIKETVNQALMLASSARDDQVREALDTLAAATLHDRSDAWR